MLGLVAYEGSSDEEDSNEAPPLSPQVQSKKSQPENVALSEPHISDDEDSIVNSSDNLKNLNLSSDTNIFQLPTPTSHDLKPPIQSIKKHGGVKISIPSLDEFDEEEEEEAKPRKAKLMASAKGSSLFSMLPKPRNEFLATPRQLPSRTPVPAKLNKSPATKPNKPNHDEEEDGDNEDETEADFFTIPDKTNSSDDLTVPDKTLEEYMKPLVQTKSSKSNEMLAEPDAPECLVPANTQDANQSDNQQIELNNDVLRKLGARKRKGEELVVREVDASSLLPDATEWTKHLSEETAYRPSHKKHEGPTSQQKRKHHITYLAFQAKANELDLKNQWANNRQSKRTTQSKYGF